MAPTNGWAAPGWDAIRAAFDRNFDEGQEVGAAFCAYHNGSRVVDLWGGIADPDTGSQWSEDTLVLVYSTTKGVTAMCANRLADEGLIDVDAPVKEYWPEFAQNGKESITVSDLLSHRAGLAWTDGRMSASEMFSWDPVIRALEPQAPSWEPRTAHGYHATTYGWLVGEVVRRVSGRSVGRYLRDEIAGPLGAEFYIGLPPGDEHRVATLVPFAVDDLLPNGVKGGAGRGTAETGPPPSSPSGSKAVDSPAQLTDVVASYFGGDSPLLKALTAPGGAFRDQRLWNSPELHAAEIPAANGICDARSLARLYSACIGDVPSASGSEYRVMSEGQLDRALQQQTEGPDKILLDLDIQWGLGFMLNRGVVAQQDMGGARAFGHFGMGGSAGWADPESGLAVGYVMNKMGMGTTGDPRAFRLIKRSLEVARSV